MFGQRMYRRLYSLCYCFYVKFMAIKNFFKKYLQFGWRCMIIDINHTRHAYLTMRTSAGYLFMKHQKIYSNEAITVENQLKLLIEQGLLIPNLSEAEFHLSIVNYHRLY